MEGEDGKVMSVWIVIGLCLAIGSIGVNIYCMYKMHQDYKERSEYNRRVWDELTKRSDDDATQE